MWKYSALIKRHEIVNDDGLRCDKSPFAYSPYLMKCFTTSSRERSIAYCVVSELLRPGCSHTYYQSSRMTERKNSVQAA